MTRTVILIGGTSYVARAIIDALADDDVRILAVTRRPAISGILLGDCADRVEAVAEDDAIKRAQGTECDVVNLAFVRGAQRHQVFSQLRRLLDSVHRIVSETRSARLIHCSSVVVFGYAMKEVPAPRPVSWVPGDGYVDQKAHAEEVLLRRATHAPYRLAVVRLGHVLGPRGPWTAALLQSMLEGRPLAYEGRLGPSNAAYHPNIGSYVRHLLTTPAEALDAFGPFHHLADLSAHSWKEVLDRLAAAVGLSYQTVSYVPPPPSRTLVGSARAVARQIYHGAATDRLLAAVGSRWDASWLEPMLIKSRIGVQLTPPQIVESDRWRLDAIGNPDEFEFKSHLLAGWEPPIGFEAAMAATASWAAETYALRPPP